MCGRLCKVFVWESLTLSADDYKRDLSDRPMHGKLVVEFVNFLEAGHVFQAEDQDDGVHPARKLKKREKNRHIRTGG